MNPIYPICYPLTRIKNLFLLLLLLAGFSRAATAQAPINAYARVTNISGTTLTLSNINQTYHTFAAGENIVIIQMQDTVIGADTANNTSFGTIGSIAHAGVYQPATISSIVGSTMVLTAGLTSTYNTTANARVQVVSFQSLSAGNYTLNTGVTAVPWDGNVGGIIAFQVGGTLTLNANVSADAAGFRGGSVNVGYELGCESTVYYSTNGTKYAYKGEGIYSTPTISYTLATGREPLINGGGGGSDDNGGGGGGGNFTAGGQGGHGWTCSGNPSGGFGGVALGTYISGGRVFMGGGGGGGQQNNAVGTNGVAGGGIVFIKATQIKTTCTGSYSITAAGASATTSGNDGAGGAGAAGTVVLGVSSYNISGSCPLTIASNGGNGGNVGDNNGHGGGGGGGQGAVIFSSALPGAGSNVTATTNNGNGGANSAFYDNTYAGNGAGSNNAGIISGATVVLPVDFLSITATRSGQDNVVSFTTGQTLQAVQYTIQRSADGSQFSDIGTVLGVTSSDATESYAFTDALPNAGKNFYRVRSTDVSGGEKYSTVVSVDRSDKAGGFHIYPNPAHGAFTIQLRDATMNGSVGIAIEDLSGATVYRSLMMANNGRVSVANIGSLTAGIYLIRVETQGGVQTGKLILH